MSGVAASRGGTLLMVMVLIGMMSVMFVSSISIISRELHVTSDAEQKERTYRVAEAGIQQILFWVGKAGKDTAFLLGKNGEQAEVHDPVTHNVIGTYTLAVSPLPSPAAGISVSSTASSAAGAFCSKVQARIEGIGSQYRVLGWAKSSC